MSCSGVKDPFCSHVGDSVVHPRFHKVTQSDDLPCLPSGRAGISDSNFLTLACRIVSQKCWSCHSLVDHDADTWRSPPCTPLERSKYPFKNTRRGPQGSRLDCSRFFLRWLQDFHLM